MKPHPHRAGRWDWISFLVTGPEAKLEHFCSLAPVEVFDRRGQTLRCRAFGPNRGQDSYDQAVKAAKEADVTLQDLVTHETEGPREAHYRNLGGDVATVRVSDCSEEYPVVVLGGDGMQWGTK